MEALFDIDPRHGLVGFFIALIGILIKAIYSFAKGWKTRVIAKWDEHYEKTEDHEVTLAVHAEKHRSHEKRLDNIEDDRTGSGEK